MIFLTGFTSSAAMVVVLLYVLLSLPTFFIGLYFGKKSRRFAHLRSRIQTKSSLLQFAFYFCLFFLNLILTGLLVYFLYLGNGGKGLLEL